MSGEFALLWIMDVSEDQRTFQWDNFLNFKMDHFIIIKREIEVRVY